MDALEQHVTAAVPDPRREGGSQPRSAAPRMGAAGQSRVLAALCQGGRGG